MIQVFMVLVYLIQPTPTSAPELVIEKRPHATQERCMEATRKRVAEIQDSPKFLEGVPAACIPAAAIMAEK